MHMGIYCWQGDVVLLFVFGSTNIKLIVYQCVHQIYRGQNRILVIMRVGDAGDSPADNTMKDRCAMSIQSKGSG